MKLYVKKSKEIVYVQQVTSFRSQGSLTLKMNTELLGMGQKLLPLMTCGNGIQLNIFLVTRNRYEN